MGIQIINPFRFSVWRVLDFQFLASTSNKQNTTLWIFNSRCVGYSNPEFGKLIIVVIVHVENYGRYWGSSVEHLHVLQLEWKSPRSLSTEWIRLAQTMQGYYDSWSNYDRMSNDTSLSWFDIHIRNQKSQKGLSVFQYCCIYDVAPHVIVLDCRFEALKLKNQTN